jgi:phage anti-repressor protein
MNQIVKLKTINFNELVKNSNTTLSLNCQTKMISILNQEFTEQQQQWYIANLFMYMHYHPTNDYPVNLEHVFKMIGFANKANAKRTLKNNFTLDEDYKIVFIPKDENPKHKDLGGRPDEDIMLNVDTLKNLFLIAKTPEGKELRRYYVKLENINNKIIKEEIEEQRIQENTLKLLENKENEKILEKHNLLLTRYAQAGSLVYFIKVKSYDNGNFILRIGHSSIGLEPRFNKHKTRYEEAIILECFKVDKSSEFESFIHNYMNNALVTNLPGHENEKEIFLIKNYDEYNKLIDLVTDNIKKFNKTDYLEISDLQNEIIKLQSNTDNNDERFDKKLLNQIIENQNKTFELIHNINITQNKLENTLISLIKNSNNRTSQEYNTIIKPLQGPKVIQIDSEKLTINKVYDTIIELLKSDPRISRTSLKRAVENSNIYRNYRWMFIDRNSNINEIIIEQNNSITCEIKCVGVSAVTYFLPNITKHHFLVIKK